MLDTYTQYIKSFDLKKENIHSNNEFPFNLPILQGFEEVIFHPNVTYFIGENGSGKSTLLEALAVALGFNPEGGTKNFNFSSFDSHSSLDEHIVIRKGVRKEKRGFFFRAETFYNVASYIDELDREPAYSPSIIGTFGGKSLHEQSHGEAFFSTFVEKFKANGLYILDEPESALSPIKQLSMLARIHELVQEDCQFIISTHSPILMAYPQAKILELTDQGLQPSLLEDTEHYQMMEQFFTDRDRLLHHLFK